MAEQKRPNADNIELETKQPKTSGAEKKVSRSKPDVLGWDLQHLQYLSSHPEILQGTEYTIDDIAIRASRICADKHDMKGFHGWLAKVPVGDTPARRYAKLVLDLSSASSSSEEDKQTAWKLLYADAQSGYVPAITECVRLMYEGYVSDEFVYEVEGTIDFKTHSDKFKKQLFDLCLQAAQSGDKIADVWIGYFYMFGIGVAKDVKLSLNHLNSAANAANPWAFSIIGWYINRHNGNMFGAARCYRNSFLLYHEGSEARQKTLEDLCGLNFSNYVGFMYGYDKAIAEKDYHSLSWLFRQHKHQFLESVKEDFVRPPKIVVEEIRITIINTLLFYLVDIAPEQFFQSISCRPAFNCLQDFFRDLMYSKNPLAVIEEFTKQSAKLIAQLGLLYEHVVIGALDLRNTLPEFFNMQKVNKDEMLDLLAAKFPQNFPSLHKRATTLAQRKADEASQAFSTTTNTPLAKSAHTAIRRDTSDNDVELPAQGATSHELAFIEELHTSYLPKLASLRAAGCRLYVATKKPEVQKDEGECSIDDFDYKVTAGREQDFQNIAEEMRKLYDALQAQVKKWTASNKSDAKDAPQTGQETEHKTAPQSMISQNMELIQTQVELYARIAKENPPQNVSVTTSSVSMKRI